MYFSLIHVHHSFTIVKSCPTKQKPLLWAWVGYSVNEGDGEGGQPWCVMEGATVHVFLLTPAVYSRGWVGGGPSQNSHEDSWSVFTASAGLHQGCPHQSPGFLAVGWFCGPALNSWAKKTPCFFSHESLMNMDHLPVHWDNWFAIVTQIQDFPVYSLNYIMLILTHYSKLSNLVLCHLISVISSDNLMSLEVINKKSELEGPRMESWDQALEISF